MRPEQVLAWLPFAVSLAIAFLAGFVFARLCQGRTVAWPSPSAHVRRGGGRPAHGRHVEITDGLTVALVYLVLFVLWLIAAMFVWRMVR